MPNPQYDTTEQLYVVANAGAKVRVQVDEPSPPGPSVPVNVVPILGEQAHSDLGTGWGQMTLPAAAPYPNLQMQFATGPTTGMMVAAYPVRADGTPDLGNPLQVVDGAGTAVTAFDYTPNVFTLWVTFQ